MEIVAWFPLLESGTAPIHEYGAGAMLRCEKSWEIISRSFLIHFQKYSGFLLIAALGLFQIGVHMKLLKECWWNFHLAVDHIVNDFKQGCCLMARAGMLLLNWKVFTNSKNVFLFLYSCRFIHAFLFLSIGILTTWWRHCLSYSFIVLSNDVKFSSARLYSLCLSG